MGWIRLDFGLLDDAEFSSLSAAARGAWITIYLLQKRREGAVFKDHAEICRLLRKEGFNDPDVLVSEMMPMLDAPDPDGPALGIRGYAEYQKDPTSPVRQKRYRDKMRALRNEPVTSHDGTGRDIHTAGAHARVPEKVGKTAAFDEAMKAAGLRADLSSKEKKAKPGVDGDE